MIRVKSPSRIHMGLIDMNAELGRVDGGVGLSIDQPYVLISAEVADDIEIIGQSFLAQRMEAAVRALVPEGQGVRVTIEADMPPHVGCGSGTQAALSVAAAVNRLYGLGLSVREMAIAVGRGGTSGIGVASFEKGGFIVDGGHKFAEKGSFSPSSASKTPPGPVLFREDFPDWEIVLALPSEDMHMGAHDAQEVDIFEKECPIPLHEVQAVAHIVLMNMMPAIMEKDIEAFGKATDRLQTMGFKQREIHLQHQAVRDLIELLQDSGAYGAGMSSFGPVVYAFTDNPEDASYLREDAQAFLDGTIGGKVIITRANNTGASILEE
ncbi:beta-ribofuranosylaminobenzene 5'-phosphate synthase [Methanomethylovorans sp.]|uniref:beta-ribofuranosylaminobenzene 5'-phosphate synthase n=1 Tax=Methanomethylovorans sp. TaxID=2758717 RepID=UPI000B163C86|nr:beta-ribofuranosylaminobenzene 5'-phosphate synthase [Methanomethylovorans sp.]